MFKALYKLVIFAFLNIKYSIKKCRIKSLNVSKDILLGENVRIGKKAIVMSGVKIGNYSYLNTQFGNTFIDSNVVIGNYTSIGPNVCIALGNHNYSFISTHPFLYDKKYGYTKKNLHKKDDSSMTHIGNDVWIGANSNIKRGVTIGNGAVIGMNTVVTKNIPEYAIVVGNPAKIIKYRFNEKQIDYLNSIKWWEMNINEMKKKRWNLYNIDELQNRNKEE